MQLSNFKTEIEDLENRIKKKIILATSNPHKLEEINEINTFSDIEFQTVQGNFNPDETGSSYLENAYIKAFEAAKKMNEIALADDSGLNVDALEGAPGIHSARYADSPIARIKKLLKNLEGIEREKRTAHFTCAMALVCPEGKILYQCEGKVCGIIIDEIKGKNGFGYDPVFYLPEYKKTMAQIEPDIKNKISHRANALGPMLEWIHKNLV